jgi:hypothetical protein
MAAWQLPIFLIPKSWADANAGDINQLLTDDGVDTSLAWCSVIADRKKFEEAFGKVLMKGNPWHADETIWGNEQKTDIQLWVEQGRIETIQLRIDLREDWRRFIPKFCEAMEGLECMALVPEMNRLIVIALTPEALTEVVLTSRAASFVSNPRTYLSKLSDS